VVGAQLQTNWLLTVPVTWPRTLHESPSLTITAATAGEYEPKDPIVSINSRAVTKITILLSQFFISNVG
ncbi:MAG: hypothetical protein NTX25_17305, partial [Proteobacteria bacterium]|nr:hypothetical protein [Pseudomonadota bacterium]